MIDEGYGMRCKGEMDCRYAVEEVLRWSIA
jgi:hypothetical protein